MKVTKTKNGELQFNFDKEESLLIISSLNQDGLIQEHLVENSIDWKKGMRKNFISLIEDIIKHYGGHRYISLKDTKLKDLMFKNKCASIIWTINNLEKKGLCEVNRITMNCGKTKATHIKLLFSN